jgi:hypothetical protein
MRPLSSYAERSVSDKTLTITKTAGAEQASVYEVQTPCRPNAPALGWISLKKKAWAGAVVPWGAGSSIVAPYLGFSHGSYNTGVFASLLSGGGITLGGPMQVLGSPRPGAQALPFAWDALDDDERIEFCCAVEPGSLGAVFSVWVQLGDSEPYLLASLQESDLGTFQSREKQDAVTLFFGNGSVLNETVEFPQWALFPDFRTAVRGGIPEGDHDVLLSPSSPGIYTPKTNRTPEALLVAPWSISEGVPKAVLHANPGQLDTPHLLRLDVSETPAVYVRDEPNLADPSGFCIEALMGAEATSPPSSTRRLSVGFAVEDGSNLYEVRIFQHADGSSTVGLCGTTQDFVGDEGIDFSTPKNVRLTVCKGISSYLTLEVDDRRVLLADLGETLPLLPASQATRVRFGQMSSDNAATALFQRVLYQPGIRLWDYPGDPSTMAGYAFYHSGAGHAVLGDPFLELTGHAFYSKEDPFSLSGGSVIDFACGVGSYADSAGRVFSARTRVGAELGVFFGHRALRVGFYACGAHGRKVAILPGSGTETDILDQTPLGRRFSASVDWLEVHDYRLVVKGYSGIELYVDRDPSPAISLPWVAFGEDFDLPHAFDSASLVFGNTHVDLPCKSYWEYVRYSISRGLDVSVRQMYPQQPTSSHFGGICLFLVDWDDQ